jgi:hypothetical protein
MSRPSSFTSNSDPHEGGGGSRQACWRLAGWAIICLIALDVAASFAFAYPSDPRTLSPGRLALYFDYGRSMEGRLRRATRADPEKTAPITLSGWYRPLVAVTRPKKPNDTRVHIYGMSHAVRLADALQSTSPTLSVRSIAAPGATANWAFGAFRRDRGRREGDVAVLALMSSTLPMVTTMSPMTWNISFAMPYTSDRYRLRNGTLTVTRPPYDSFSGYVAALNDSSRWVEAKKVIAANDPFYDRWLFDETFLDSSSLVRLTRRARAQKRDRQRRALSLNEAGFVAESEAVQLANAIVIAFARQAKCEHVLPVIYIVNNQGYGDHLFRALEPALRREQIPFLNSASIIDPNDGSSYLPDTHFTDQADRLLAIEIDRIVNKQMQSQARKSRALGYSDGVSCTTQLGTP